VRRRKLPPHFAADRQRDKKSPHEGWIIDALMVIFATLFIAAAWHQFR
jgi:hypothetical protein